jgi:mannose-6-phosphate isomerase-like protein (cupin superfamily)
MSYLAGAAETDGSYGLVHVWAPAGSSPPLHVHHSADEAFYVLDGELRIVCGGEEYRAPTGACALLPRGLPHTFIVEGERDARLLTLISPGGSESFFAEAGSPASGEGLPPAGPPDLATLMRVGAQHDIEILGPPLRPDAPTG